MKHNQTLVSICVPTYNGEKYLEETLTSILSQSYNNYEVLIIDDQSTDNTWSIAQEFSLHDHRIKIYKNENNLGLVKNWNKCISLAKGDWIKFVFQDDTIRPDCLKLMMDATEDGSLLIACWREFIFSEETTDQVKKEYMEIPSLSDIFDNQTYAPPSQLAKACSSQNGNFIGEPSNILFHKSLVKKYGQFNKNFVQICDFEYWLRVGLNEGIKIIPQMLTRFRVHENSTSTKNSSNLFRAVYMEKLLLLHEYLYNPFFSTLKETVTDDGRKVKITKEFAELAYWLRSTAYENEKSDTSINEKKRWDELVVKFPKLESSIYIMPLRIKGWFDKHLLWRFKK